MVKKGRPLILETVEPERTDLETGVRAYEVERSAGERVFVFVLSAEDRTRVSHVQVEEMEREIARHLAPNRAVFLLVQPGCKLAVYEAREP